MNLKELTNTKLVVVLRKKKHVRYLLCAKLVNRIGSALYNVALLTLASKQTYSTLAIALVKLLENFPGFFDPILAYLTDRETRRLKKAALLNWIQVLIYFVIAFLMLQYQIPLALFIVILLANVVSDSTVKAVMSATDRFSIKDFFQKMKLAYVHMQKRNLLQMIWLLAMGKATYASFLLLLNVAMVSTSTLRFGSYAQTLAILSCFLGLSLIDILILKLIGTFLSGYIAPKYYTDLIQRIDEEPLTRVNSLNNFILLLADPVGILLATICLQLFGLKISWLLELGLLLVFMLVGELLLYRNKKRC